MSLKYLFVLSEITKLILNQVDAAFTSNFTITSCGLLVVGNCLFCCQSCLHLYCSIVFCAAALQVLFAYCTYFLDIN